MRAKLAVALILVTWMGVAAAQWRQDGELVADTSWRKTWGNYGAMLHLTDQSDELFAAWQKPGPAVQFRTTDVARRGEPIVGVVFFSGCEVDENGLCDVTATFRVFKPDGSPYGAEEKGEFWKGQPPPPPGELQLGIGAIGVVIEPQDPHGTYTVRAYLVDNISQADVELTRTFSVAPGAQGQKLSQ